jgi:hypothetical protein
MLKGGGKKPKPSESTYHEIGLITLNSNGKFDAHSWVNMGKGIMPMTYMGNWSVEWDDCELELMAANVGSAVLEGNLNANKNIIDGAILGSDNFAVAFQMKRAATGCTKASGAGKWQFSGLGMYKGSEIAYFGKDTVKADGTLMTEGYISGKKGGEYGPFKGNFTVASDCSFVRTVENGEKYVGIMLQDKSAPYLNYDKQNDMSVARATL